MAALAAAAVLVAVAVQELRLVRAKSAAVVMVVPAEPPEQVGLAAMGSLENRLRFIFKVELPCCSMTMHSTCRLSL